MDLFDTNTLASQVLSGVVSILLLVLIFIIIIGFIYMLLQWWKHRGREDYALDFVTLMIRLPKENEIKIDAAEQMFASLYSLKKGGWFKWAKAEDVIAFEMVALKEEIAFYVQCSQKVRDFVEKQIHGAYPTADIKEVDEVNIFSRKGHVEFASLKLDKSNYLPLKNYKDLPTDGMSLITSALSKMGEGEGAILQMVIQPTSKNWQKKGSSYVRNKKKKEADPDTASYDHDPKEIEAINQKIEKPGFYVSIRLVVSSPHQHMAESHIKNIKGAFSQFSSGYNGFKKITLFLKHLFMIDFLYRYMPLIKWRTPILNSEELATIFHFPNKTVETHHIKWLIAKNAPAPNMIPTSGLYMGKSVYRGEERQIYMDIKDRRRHMYIIGKTGTGKSEFLKEMILQDIEAGNGVCAIDPHGEFVEDILQLMPPERAEDVIYFNPSDLDRPMGLNIMEAHSEEQQHFVVSSVIGLMYKLYDPHRTGIIGPRFEHAIRNAMLCASLPTFVKSK